jgi:hypothetical protein
VTAPEIQRRALRYMRDKQAVGCHDKHALCDHAVKQLETVDRYPADQAARAAEIVWTKHFATYGPN